MEKNYNKLGRHPSSIFKLVRQMTIESPDIIKNVLIFKCYFLRRAHSTEQAPFTRVFPPGTHLKIIFNNLIIIINNLIIILIIIAELTEAMRIKCLAHGNKLLV